MVCIWQSRVVPLDGALVVPQGIDEDAVHVRLHPAFIPWTAEQFAQLPDLLPMARANLVMMIFAGRDRLSGDSERAT